MRTQYKVVGILFGVEVLAWLLSAFFVSLISGEAFTWGLFSFEAPAHIARILTISVITLIAAGIVIWRLLARRERAEKALRESEIRYRNIVELAPDGIIAVDNNGIISSCNKAFSEQTGYEMQEYIGRHFVELPTIGQEGIPGYAELFASVLGGKELETLEFPWVHRDGTTRYGEIRATVMTVDGQLKGVQAIVRDITERKRVEDRERQLQAELIHSRRLAAIGELAAGIAHEINNPLTGILGYSQRLLRKSTDEEMSQDLARVTNEAQRVSKIVENLLTFARRREPKKEQIDVNDVLQRTLELRAYELKTSNIEVEVELASGLRGVRADFQQIQEVFLNLILNAEQAMSEEKKGGKLGIKTERVKGGIRVSFGDDGPGIKAGNLDSLFDPFFTTRGERGGTGLGLSVCHGIVTEHGGRIYAESEEGKGATFSVELPVASKK